MGDASGPLQSGLNTQSTTKKGRGCTRMKRLQLLTARKERKSIDFNSYGQPIGELAHDFKYHVAALARERISILIDEWDKVGSDDRNEIWKGLKELWDIPKNDAVEKKTMVYAGERWNSFKNSLTSRYLVERGKKFGMSAANDYSYIDKETWKAFVKSREEPSFLEKRKRGQKAQSYNKYPHRLSQGGYALLEKNMMADRLKERQQAAGGSEVPPPSPPPRHEKWMKARTKPSGEYTSEDTRLVAEKIDSLVSEGTFVPQGRHDILTEATGRGEHPGRVRGVGGGVGIRQFFGSHSHIYSGTPPVMNKEQIDTIKAELTKEIKEQVMQDISSLPPFSQKYPNYPICSHNTTPQYESAKGSCAEIPYMSDDDLEDIPEECELYIDGNTNVVAYANVHRLGPNIHNQVLNNDMVRVSVTKVIYANAEVPVPTCEVATVGEAPNNFIQWPKRLLKLTSKKKYDAQPIKSEPIYQKLVVKAINMDQTLKLNGEFGGTSAFIELPRDDIMNLCMGTKELSITILQVWLIYLHRYCMELGNNNVYGFIDPHFTHSQNERGSVQSYIQKKMCDDKKICYLAPYFNNHHWQLFIINPTKLEVVFLCSLGKRPDKKIYEILDTALTTYNKLQRARKQKKVDWLFPTSQKQKASYECGYFIMIHMLNIVSATLVGSWTQIFGDSKPFQKDEVKNVQERCGNIILEHIEASTDNDMN